MGPGDAFEHVARKIVAKAHPGVLATIAPADDTLSYLTSRLGRGPAEAWSEYFALGQATLTMLTNVLQWSGRGWSGSKCIPVSEYSWGPAVVSHWL